MPDAASKSASADSDYAGVSVSDVVEIKEQSPLERLLSSQAFWVAIALLMIIALMVYLQPAFSSTANFYNVTRNFAYIGIMSLGMVCVIITGGIDLSVGSVMGLVGVTVGVVLQAEYDWYVAVFAGLAVGALAGSINGVLIAYAGLPPFVVTLGMLSFARSMAIVLSQNRMIYEFGPGGDAFKIIGGGSMLGMSNMVWALIALTIVMALILKFTTWGRHLYSIGGNEHAAQLTGVPVARVKLQAYVVCSLMAAISAILVVGWQGSAINALGMAYELRVIASTVIGGANLMGGAGGPVGSVIGAALLEVIRNSLLMQGIDSNWQGAFVGVFIVLAVLLEKVRGGRRT